jgi:hypothetical protein
MTEKGTWNLKTCWDFSKTLINVDKDTEDSGIEDLTDRMYEKFIEKTYQVIRQLEEIGLPKKDQQIRLVTMRSFNAIHFINYIAKKEVIEELLVVVYSINAEAAKFLNEMINNGIIEKATVLMSNLRNKAHREKEQITRDLFVGNKKIDLFFCSSHSKIISMRTKNGNFYTIEGSGNLSYNSRVENYVLDNDEGLFDFTKIWMNDVKTYLKGKKELILT